MTIWVNKTGAGMNVGQTQKGANAFAFNTDHIDADWQREFAWNAWLYALGVTLDETDSFFVRINYTTPASLAISGGQPYDVWGMFKTAEADWLTNAAISYESVVHGLYLARISEDDGTGHSTNVAWVHATSKDYYTTIIYDSVANTLTTSVYLVAGDVLQATRQLSTVGWSWFVDMVGISNYKVFANPGQYNSQWEVTLIKANSGTTEEFPSAATQNRIMMIM